MTAPAVSDNGASERVALPLRLLRFVTTGYGRFGILAFALGAALFRGFLETAPVRSLATAGQELRSARATVLDCSLTRARDYVSKSVHAPVYAITYRFAVDDRQYYGRSYSNSPYQVGDESGVGYRSDDPSLSVLHGMRPGAKAMPGIFKLYAVLGLFGGLWLMRRGWRLSSGEGPWRSAGVADFIAPLFAAGLLALSLRPGPDPQAASFPYEELERRRVEALTHMDAAMRTDDPERSRREWRECYRLDPYNRRCRNNATF